MDTKNASQEKRLEREILKKEGRAFDNKSIKRLYSPEQVQKFLSNSKQEGN